MSRSVCLSSFCKGFASDFLIFIHISFLFFFFLECGSCEFCIQVVAAIGIALVGSFWVL